MPGIRWFLPGLAASTDPHPMLVHFPVALFPLSLLLALLALRSPGWLGKAARLTLLLAAGSMIPAAAAGLRAQQFMVHGPGTYVLVHRTFMLGAFGLALLLSAIVIRQRDPDSSRARLILIGGLLVVNVVVLLGADRGALVALTLRTGEDLHLSSARHPSIGAGKDDLTPRLASSGAPGDTTRGRVLYTSLDCDGCHGDAGRVEGPGLPPALAYAGSKLRPAWVAGYLRHPYRMRWLDTDKRPLTRMPGFGLDSSEAEDLTSLLAGRTDPGRFPPGPVENPPLQAGEVEVGRGLLAQYACRGCHQLEGAGNRLGPALDGVGLRLRPAYLYAFLKNPRAVITGTAMPNFHLWNDELRALTAYLASLDQPSPGALDGGHAVQAN